MLTSEERIQFSEILDELGKVLDISPSQHEAAVKSYEFVGNWLSAPDSPLSLYYPEVRPQGSFLLGTMIKPVHEDDELDIDIVCQFTGKKESWTQADLKKVVGDRLKAHNTLKRLLDEEGRRCWTLRYAETAKFHLDILPAIVNSGYKVLLENAMSAENLDYTNDLSIRITDKKLPNYLTSTRVQEWLKSDPFAYAIWFYSQASVNEYKTYSLLESTRPVPIYQKNKLPLQRIVQILKWHRDLMFKGDCCKPISIIITTLAGKAYQQQHDITQGLVEVIDRIPLFIEERYDFKYNRKIKWIGNPVNLEENFADKWPDEAKKEESFFDWLKQVKGDIKKALGQKQMFNIHEALRRPFGEKEIDMVFNSLGNKAKAQRDTGKMRMASGTGLLGEIGRTTIVHHTNFGNNA